MSTPDAIQKYQQLRAELLQMEQEDSALPKQAGFLLGVSHLASIEAIYKATEANRPQGLLG